MRRSDGRRRQHPKISRWTLCRSRKRECVCKCNCGGYSNSSGDSDSVDTVVCNKNYRTYMCKAVCSSGSDSDVTDVNDSMLQCKLYQSVLQKIGRASCRERV